MIYTGIAAGILLLETLVKKHIENHRKEGEITPKCGGLLWIRKYHNRGAFLNLGETHPALVEGVSILLCVLLTAGFVFSLGRAGNKTLKAGLAFLLGGAYSNTYDRLRRKYVVDYFSIHIEKIPFRGLSKVVFNLADFCIMIGAVLMVVGAK